MRRSMLVTAAVGAAVALSATVTAATASAGPDPATSARPMAPAPAAAIAHGGQIRGIIVSDVNRPPSLALADLARLKADGVNLVSLYVTQYQNGPTASTIAAGPMTPTDAELTAFIDLAKTEGFAVELSPIVWTSGAYTWRGGYEPDNVDAWFASYRTMIDHYAQLAADTGVDVFAVGSEYGQLEKYAAQWTQTVASVRALYHGLVTYMTTTQRMAGLTWWHAVDLISVSPYYDVSEGKANPTYADMKHSWSTHFLPMVRKLTAKFHKPVLFDEVGYLSAQGTASQAWNPQPAGPADEQVQADAYAALLDATASQSSWLRGVVFYKWDPLNVPSMDTSYSPRGKLAECALADRWSQVSNPLVAAAAATPGACATTRVASSLG